MKFLANFYRERVISFHSAQANKAGCSKLSLYIFVPVSLSDFWIDLKARVIMSKLEEADQRKIYKGGELIIPPKITAVTVKSLIAQQFDRSPRTPPQREMRDIEVHK